MKRDPDLPAPDVLIAAVLYLMSSDAGCQCPKIRRMVARHLDCIARHPDAAVTPMLRELCGKLAYRWERLSAEADQREARAVRYADGQRLH